MQDDPLERPRGCVRDRQVRNRFACRGGGYRRGYLEGSLFAYRRRRFGGLHQQVRPGGSGVVRFDGRRRPAGVYGGQRAPGRGGDPQISRHSDPDPK